MKKKAIVVLAVLTIVAAAVCFAACGEGVKVTLDLAGGVYGGSDENIVATVKGGQIDLGEYRPEYEGAQISGWTDEEGNFYGAHAIVAGRKRAQTPPEEKKSRFQKRKRDFFEYSTLPESGYFHPLPRKRDYLR